MEEYTPLLARGTGVADSTVPLLVLLVEAGVAIGGLFAGVAARIPVRRFAVVLALAAIAMAVGAYGRAAPGIVLVAAAFGVFQLATVLADVRLQRAITGNHRATVTSVASFGTDLATVAVFGLYAAGSAYASHGTVFAWFALPYLVVAVIWAARHNGRPPSPDATPTSLSEVRLQPAAQLGVRDEVAGLHQQLRCEGHRRGDDQQQRQHDGRDHDADHTGAVLARADGRVDDHEHDVRAAVHHRRDRVDDQEE